MKLQKGKSGTEQPYNSTGKDRLTWQQLCREDFGYDNKVTVCWQRVFAEGNTAKLSVGKVQPASQGKK